MWGGCQDGCIVLARCLDVSGMWAYYLDSFVGLAGYLSRFVFLTGWTDIFCIIQVVSGE